MAQFAGTVRNAYVTNPPPRASKVIGSTFIFVGIDPCDLGQQLLRLAVRDPGIGMWTRSPSCTRLRLLTSPRYASCARRISRFFFHAAAKEPDRDLIALQAKDGENTLTLWATIAPPRNQVHQQRPLKSSVCL